MDKLDQLDNKQKLNLPDCEFTLLSEIYDYFEEGQVNPSEHQALAYAYIGDAFYEIVIRTLVVNKNNKKVNEMHKITSSIVKAETQAKMMEIIEGELSEEEENVYRRGRNAKSQTMAKNASVHDYRIATGFEALMGYLYLKGRERRAIELIKIGMESGK